MDPSDASSDAAGEAGRGKNAQAYLGIRKQQYVPATRMKSGGSEGLQLSDPAEIPVIQTGYKAKSRTKPESKSVDAAVSVPAPVKNEKGGSNGIVDSSVQNDTAVTAGASPEEKEKDDSAGPILVRQRRSEGHRAPVHASSSVLQAVLPEAEKCENRITDFYRFGPKIGTGAFSVVRKCQDRKTKHLWAVKIIGKKNQAGEQATLQMLRDEVEILKRLSDNPNIVMLNEVFETSDTVFLVMEYVRGGELFERLIEMGTGYTEKEARHIFRQILQGVKHLHDNNVAHRDLKPENLLVEGNGENMQVKISDMGLSRFFTRNSLMETACGSPQYVAPEVVSNRGYSKACDMWSAGVILFVLLSGDPPFYVESGNVVELLEKVAHREFSYSNPIWQTVSEKAINLIDQLICLDPEYRLTAEEALRHPWFRPGTSLSRGPLNWSFTRLPRRI